MPPFRFLVYRGLSNRAQRPDGPPINANRTTGHVRSRRLIHEGHELVGEAWHGAADADAAHVGAAADACHPSAFGDVAVDYWTPASQLHDALRRAVDFREITLLVVAGSVATIVDSVAE